VISSKLLAAKKMRIVAVGMGRLEALYVETIPTFQQTSGQTKPITFKVMKRRRRYIYGYACGAPPYEQK
jgi:hypothetical protein